MNMKKSSFSNFPLGDKKGAWGPAPTMLDCTSYIVLIIAMVLAMIMFTVQSNKIEHSIDLISVNQEKGYLMLNMLRSPVNGSANVGELISKWYLDDSNKDDLRKAISDIVNLVYDGTYDWELEVEKEKIGTLDFKKKAISMISRVPIDKIDATIPISYNPDELVVDLELKIYLGAVREGSWCWNFVTEACSIGGKICKCDRVGHRLIWTECLACANGCEPENKVCKGENIVEEGTRCYNLFKERCTSDDKLCNCDGFSWKNCVDCDKGCDQVANTCK